MTVGPTAAGVAVGRRTGRRDRTDRRSPTGCDDRRGRGSTRDRRSRPRLREEADK
ncbi:hypothetical protein [Halorubrum coriense]|uniref:hypothetical protein n=1 Tax=Halorubrum coriense TaxID=64713 RepID=UPI000A68F728|nr:hypothetical protein [Halorubrum coriense]